MHLNHNIRGKEAKRDEEKKNVKEAAAKSSSNEERTTLGDIDALAELKKKMEGGK